MSHIAVVTDSTSTLPKELVQRYNIYVAPLSVTWDKVRYRDGVDLQIDEFYQRLRKSKTLPTTSSAIQGEFLQLFEELRGKVDGIVAVVLSGGLGAAYSSAMNAKEMVPEVPVEVIDSRLACTGMGFGAIAAAKVALAGGNIEEVTRAAKDILKKTHILFCMETIEYLRRGGRINLPAAMMATLLRVKPIMVFKDGKVEPVARPRTRPKAMESLLNLMKERTSDTPLHVAVENADDLDGAEALKKLIAEQFECAELFITGFTPVIGTHMGPGALGISFYNE